MSHCDEQTLALMALGEPGPSTDVEHVAGCTRCRADLESLRAVVTLARGDDAPPVVPPPSVWAGIAAATGVRVAPREDALMRSRTPTPPVSTETPSGASGLPRPGATAGGGGTVHPIRRPPRRERPRRRWAPLLAVAAAGLVVGGIGGLLAGGALDGGSQAPPPTSVVLASAPLSGLEGAPDASGEAQVVQTTTGRVLQMDVADLGVPDGFYEVWLIDASVQRMVPMGILQGDTGQFAIPDELDLGEFPVVDVSVEPLDGDPAHSGSSVLRGTIPA